LKAYAIPSFRFDHKAYRKTKGFKLLILGHADRSMFFLWISV